MDSSRIPFSTRAKNLTVNSIRGLNFDDISTDTLIKKVDANNAGNSNILSSFAENVGGSTKSSTTTFISGNPDTSSIIGGKIITQDDGDTTEKEFKLSCGEGSRERSIVIVENQPVLINNDLAVYNELSCGELQVDNLIKLGVDSGNAGEVLTSNGSNNPTWSAIPPITAIDNIIIGANTPAEGSFTNLSATGTVNTEELNGATYLHIRSANAIKMHFTNYFTYSYSHFLSAYSGARDLGSASYKWRTLYATVTTISSDDRLKINERPIQGALELISNLNYYEYERVQDLNGKDAVGTDRGVIAQQLLNTDISFAVLGGGTEEIEVLDKDENKMIKKTVEVPYSVNYNVLLATSLQAIKDLNVVVSDLRERLDALENK